jgi:hypothetical protein
MARMRRVNVRAERGEREAFSVLHFSSDSFKARHPRDRSVDLDGRVIGRNSPTRREQLSYFSAENAVGVSISLRMVATIGPSRSLSSRALCQAGSFTNAVHFASRSAKDSDGMM